MAIKSSAGTVLEIDRTLSEIRQEGIKAVLYFFSPELDEPSLHKKVSSAFPGTHCMGASMIGGWANRGPVEKGFVALSLSSEEASECIVSFREGAKADPVRAAREVMAEIKASMGSRKLDPAEYVGIVLVDGLCLGERVIREFTMEKDFPLPIVGGAAADELAFRKTTVACDGRASGDGLALMVLKMRLPFYYDHFVHYNPTGLSCVVTKSDPGRRVVLELDGQPAAERYASMLGLRSAAEIKPMHFSHNPLGVAIGDTVYARSPNAIVGGAGMQFYCSIDAGTRVVLLKKGDIMANAREAVAAAEKRLGAVRGALLFNCVLRYLEMKEDRLLEPFNAAFAAFPFAGFNTYGEELFTHHNQTLTALFIGEGKSGTEATK
jgi:hypothetical protein